MLKLVLYFKNDENLTINFKSNKNEYKIFIIERYQKIVYSVENGENSPSHSSIQDSWKCWEKYGKQ